MQTQTPQPTIVDIADVVETQEKAWFPVSVFLMCCLIMVVDGFTQQSLNYVAPAIIADWGIGRATMAAVFDINIVGWMLGSIGLSMLGDRIGRRPSILLALLTLGIFTISLAAATNLVELSVLRFFAALGTGGSMPMAVALVADYAPTRTRGFKITLLYLGYTIGSSGGGFLAAVLTPAFGWRSVFVVGGATSLAVGAVLAIVLPESVRYLALKQQSHDRALAYARRLKPSAAFDLTTRFVVKETEKSGVLLRHLFTEGRSAMTTLLWLATGLGNITHFFLSTWLTTLLSEYSKQMTIPMAQMTSALFQLGAAFGWCVGWLLDKRGISAVAMVIVAGAFPVVGLGLVRAAPPSTMALALTSGILVLGGGIGLTAASSMMYPTFIRSTGTGAAFAAARTGALLGPAIAGYLVYLQAPLPFIFLVGALPMVAAGAITFMLGRAMTPAAVREMASTSAFARH